MSLSATISPILQYGTLLVFAIVFTFAGMSVKEGFWGTATKLIAGLFWFVLAIGQFIFFGVDGSFLVLSLPYAMFGLLFFVSIIRDSISEKKNRQWNFED